MTTVTSNPIVTETALRDRIDKILVDYANVIQARDGWVDIITTRNARADILDLLAETNSNVKLRRLAAREAADIQRICH